MTHHSEETSLIDNNSELIDVLNQLTSEDQNPDTLDIDQLQTIDVVTKLNQQDNLVAKAIAKVLPEISAAVDCIVESFRANGRLIYVGAGTSGRLGVLDAVECIPTFGIDEGVVVAILAGGESAMFNAKEGVEDDAEQGLLSLKNIHCSENDCVVGIAASGRTPFVIGALNYARSVGCKTVALSCNQQAEIATLAEIAILPIVGPEPLTGSTRMKSGTAQKMVLNTLSTASMIRIGKSYKNLMVDLRASNKKLYARGTRMIMQVTGVDQESAEQVLKASQLQVKVAILMILGGVDLQTAEHLLSKNNGFLRQALTLK